MWHILTRNSVATSCRDAAARRNRLGVEGIPIYDEMRSFCGAVYRSDGSRRIVLLHCRANAHFNVDAAGQLLGATRRIARLSPEELSRDTTAYGSVNPFSESGDYIHVFDEDVFTAYASPHTMMTNAGDHTWAVEFRPLDLVSALRADATEVHIGRIATEVPLIMPRPVFGIITGNGPESGMALWRNVNEKIHAELKRLNCMRGDLSYPRVVIESVPEMGLSMELTQRHDAVWAVIKRTVLELIGCGVTHLALACNTTQFFGDRIRNLCPPSVEFISMVDITYHHIQANDLKDITIIGIPAVAALGEFSGYSSLRALGVKQVEDHAKPHMEEVASIVKQLDALSPDPRSLNRLQYVIRSGVQTSKVLIALTEVSVLLERFPKLRQNIGGKEVIDPLRLSGEAMARIFLETLPPEEVHEALGGE